MRSAIRNALDGKKTAVEKIATLMEVLESKDDVGRIPTLLELSRIGAGLHTQTAKQVDMLIQSKLIEPALQLENGKGSTYNIAMDITNTLKSDDENHEIGLSRAGASTVLNKYKEANDLTSIKDVTNEDINAWLAENEVYAMVTRFPVPHEGGSFMGRVKLIHDRKGVIMMGINDIKNRLEGDNDGDHVEVEFLPTDEMTNDYVNHLNNLKMTTLDLNRFVKPDMGDMLSLKGRANLIKKLTAGQRAIGEISNIQSAYGAMRNIFDNVGNYKVKSPTDKVSLDIWYNGKMGWEGTVSDYLRLMIQAAVDNAKFGLLGQWKYSRENVMANLFETLEGKQISNKNKALFEAAMAVISPMITLHKSANEIRNGRNNEVGSFTFKDTLELSNKYYSYSLDRAGYIYKNMGGLDVKIKDNALNPIEMIAIAPAEIMSEMYSKYPKLDGFLISPFIINNLLQKNSHVSSMVSMVDMKEDFLKRAMSLDNKEITDLDYMKEELKKGREYANELGTEFDTIREEFKELGPQSLDYNENFLEWKEKFHKEFAGLSNVAKMEATYKFLEGYKNKITEREQKIGLYLPAVSDKPNQPNMLDYNIVKEYFKEFNKNVRDERNIGERYLSVPKYYSTDKIAEELCG